MTLKFKILTTFSEFVIHSFVHDSQIRSRLIDGRELYQVPTEESFLDFAGLKEGNIGEQRVLIKIQNANQEVDGVYYVKSTTNRSLWTKELLVGRLLKEQTNHPSFLGAKFGFRYQKEARNQAQK